jgi:hypothetical protein
MLYNFNIAFLPVILNPFPADLYLDKSVRNEANNSSYPLASVQFFRVEAS